MKRKKFGKEIFFVFIGLLLLVALILCVYTISLDIKYIETTGVVTKIRNNKVTYQYIVNKEEYEYRYKYVKEDNIKVGDKKTLYYKKGTPEVVKPTVTSKLILICPVAGIILYIISFFEIMKKRKKDNDLEEQYKTKVISVLGETQRLKIITDGDTGAEYAKSLEETMEVPIKAILKRKNEIEEIEDKKQDIFEKSLKKNKKKKFGDSRKIIPNYYYVVNNALVYEEFGKKVDEVELENITKIVKTVNKEGNVVKLVVYEDNKQYVLTNMGKCDLEVTANLLQNKLIIARGDFEFEIDNKDY